MQHKLFSISSNTLFISHAESEKEMLYSPVKSGGVPSTLSAEHSVLNALPSKKGFFLKVELSYTARYTFRKARKCDG
jgi:hypothetical protein